MIHARLIALTAVLAASAACVPYSATSGVTEELFAPLHRRDLPAFEQQIALREQAGIADGWTRVARAWLSMANCDDVEALPGEAFADEAVAAFVHATVVAEDARRRMLVGRVAASRERVGETMFRHVHSEAFFERDADEIDPDLIRWPADEEGWVDEVPAAVAVDYVCRTFPERALVDAEGEPQSLQALVDAYLEAAKTVEERLEAVPLERREGSLAVVTWRTRFYAAQVVHRLGGEWLAHGARLESAARQGRDAERNRDAASEARTRGEALEASAEERLATLVDRVPTGVSQEDAARARLLYAIHLLGAGRTALALSMLASVRDAGLTGEDEWTARYLELKVASEAARWESAAELGERLPPADVAVHPAYMYRAAFAQKRTGQVDRFLQIAMSAFRDRPYKSNAFLRALYVEMLESLAEVPFDDRVVEMLEDLGPRGGIYERVEEYARVALDRGRSTNADAAVTWLLARDRNAQNHPRYYAVRALVAFLEDDPERFRDAVDATVHRPGEVVGVVPSHRHATFFAHADTELARILRQMLPSMAEWGESAAARDRRQRWLRIIVEEVQAFMRSGGESLVRPQLTELYRLASALLEDHPRGYAERVGEREPAPLVLGTVRVEQRDLSRWEPTTTVAFPEPFSLTLLPTPDTPPERWPAFWTNEEEEGS